MNDDIRPFPIQSDLSYMTTKGLLIPPKKASEIPWWLAEEAYKYYSATYGKEQSLERLAERGGYGRKELLLFLRRGKE